MRTHTWLKVPFYYITIADRELEAAISVVELKGSGTTLAGPRRSTPHPQ
jgi:hypothetical protein